MSAAAESVLGSILIGGRDAYWQVADLLSPDDFPNARMARVYRLCGEVARSGADLDQITVGERADNDAAYVIDLASSSFSTASLKSYAEIVKSDALARRFKAICAEGAKSGDMATTQAQMSALLSSQPAHAIHASVALTRMWDAAMERLERGDALAGIETGFPMIDEMTGGLQPGRVYGVGARAKMGKTVLAMNISANVALAGHPVAVWSLEMAAEELMQRMACAEGGVPSVMLQRPRLLEAATEETQKLHGAIKRLKEAPLWISDRTDVTIEQVEAQARQMHACGNLKLLCIDYLGLLRMPKADRHDLAVAHCTRRIKIIAKELRIPVLLVFQLGRGSENGANVRYPRPSDARDSGAIEQDLDAMFLLHRPSYYDKGAQKGLRLDLAIQRNGPTGLIRMNDELDRCRFTGGTDEWVDPKVTTGRDNDL